jgi:hypothetical protein
MLYNEFTIHLTKNEGQKLLSYIKEDCAKVIGIEQT